MWGEKVEIAVNFGGINFGAVVTISGATGRVVASARIGMAEKVIAVPVESAEALLRSLSLAIEEAKRQRKLPI